jgi:putative intracellular protease/amidase
MHVQDARDVPAPAKKRIALVIANPTISTTTGWPVGFWWSELTHPYQVFTEAGCEVELFSPDGGRCEADALSDPNDASGYSRDDLITQRFLLTPELRSRVENTASIADLDVAAFDALVVAGGQSPMFSFERATALHAAFSAFYEAGKVAAALCHGVALLAFVRRPNGEYLAAGRTVTGFTNAEEDMAEQMVRDQGLLPRDQPLMPWRIENRLKEIGAHYVQADPWSPFAVRDGNLITGQQNHSGEATARRVIEALGV